MYTVNVTLLCVRFVTGIQVYYFKLTVSRIKTGVTVVKRVGRWSVNSGLACVPVENIDFISSMRGKENKGNTT